MIRMLQSQVANAKKVLETAESNSLMSQAKLTETILKPDGIARAACREYVRSVADQTDVSQRFLNSP